MVLVESWESYLRFWFSTRGQNPTRTAPIFTFSTAVHFQSSFTTFLAELVAMG
jgi:hypothetical protein